MQVDETLLQYATSEPQRRAVQAIIKHGTIRAAARHLGCAFSGVQARIYRVKINAARQGYSPEHDLTHPVPDGYKLKGASTLYDADGTQRLQWVKTQPDLERQLEIMREAVAALADDVPREPLTVPVLSGDDDLANCYIISDLHLAHKIWHEEGNGASWDMQIAERTLMRWFHAAIAASPAAATGILLNLGDLLTLDGLEPTTPASKNILDVDTRFQKVVRVAIRCLRQIMHLLLQKHDHVHVIMADANHDPASEAWLREMFAALYEHEPRVTVDTSPDSYYCYEHGDTSIYAHHGHKAKPQDVTSVFASKFRDVYGRTKYSYAHVGHRHHAQAIENQLMVVEQHQTLCPQDQYASSRGYMAQRSASVVTYSKQYGEAARSRITPQMVMAGAA